MWASTVNIGDDIQTLAAINFLKKKGITKFTFIDREQLSIYKGPPVTLIANGWYLHNMNSFPPDPAITPLFISVHISSEAKRLVHNHYSYFKKYEPIGCRDTKTVDLFKANGIKAYFTGCLTLLFDEVSQKGDKKYIVDVNTCKYIPKVKFDVSTLGNDFETVFHDINPKIKQCERLILAEKYLEKYRRAKFVVTSRLHCILPCRAFNTNARFLHEHVTSDPRFSGMHDIIRGDNDECIREKLDTIREGFMSIQL